MDTGGHFTHGTRYGATEIVSFARERHGIFGQAFLDPAVSQSLREMVPGKRVLDIGCGVGDWCYLAAQYGAKTVQGFDIQEEMVELAKQATSQLDMVHIQEGDAADMPYNDASFDVALSLRVTCNLSPRAFERHFQELYRVLVPGGKAILVAPTDWSHSNIYTIGEVDQSSIQRSITQILADVPNNPTTAQVTEAFEDVNNILMTCFSVDAEGNTFNVKNIDQLTHGQPLWRKTETMMYPNYFYSDQSIITHIKMAGLHLDSIENCYTEERRVAHNNRRPDITLDNKCTDKPIEMVYYVSKPADI